MVALLAIFLIGYVLVLLEGVLTPVFFAFLIAYMLDPVVDRFEARGVSRAMGIVVMLSIVLGGMGLFMLIAIPSITRDFAAFAESLPRVLMGLVDRAEPWLVEHDLPVPQSLDEALAQLGVDAKELASRAAAPVGAVLSWLLGGTVSLMGALVGVLIIPVFAAYLLYDFDRITAAIRELLPLRYRAQIVQIAKEADLVLGEFIRGQLIVMLALAVLYSVSYVALGVRLAVLIGVVAGFLSFIPYVGGGVALGLALLMSLLDWTGWDKVLGVIVAYTAIQLLESFVITPKIVGDKVGLSPVWVLFALMVGGEVFGFMGVLLALPTAAVLKIFVVRGIDWYRASEFFLADGLADLVDGDDEPQRDEPRLD
jgi:predicted PurR-regulated permease PerM